MQRFKVKTKLATVTVTVKDGMAVDPYKIEQYAQEALEAITWHIQKGM
jgi:hypothetical protein